MYLAFAAAEILAYQPSKFESSLSFTYPVHFTLEEAAAASAVLLEYVFADFDAVFIVVG